MPEAVLVCSEWKCHGIVVGEALCPDDNSVLEYIHIKRARCPKCGKDWHPHSLNKVCPNCGDWNLNFRASSLKRRTLSKVPTLLLMLFNIQALFGRFLFPFCLT